METLRAPPLEPPLQADPSLPVKGGRPDILLRMRLTMGGYSFSQRELDIRQRRIGLQGRPTIRFHLLANGHIRPPEVVQPSGHVMLDQAALKAVNRAAPFSAQPEELSGGVTPLEVVLVFQLI